MTDAGLVAKKLAFVETCVRELRTLARPELLETDVRERRFVEHTLQIALQACQDIASHIVSDERLGEPRTNQELFDLLVRSSRMDSTISRGSWRRCVAGSGASTNRDEHATFASLDCMGRASYDEVLHFTRLTPMKLPLLITSLALAVFFTACGDSSASGGGGAGASGSTTGAGGVGGGNPASECEEAGATAGDLAADEGTPESLTCSACLDCAFAEEGPCEDFLTPLLMEPGCFATRAMDTMNWVVCVFGDFNEPQVVTGCNTLPEADFEPCLAGCGVTYPSCEDLYLAYFSCGVCGQCLLGCDGADVDNDGANCTEAM